MTKAKSTKRALLLSVLSMMLCMAMLVGSTFAWFTDTVSSGKNQIVAGNLDVEMKYAVLNDDGSIKEWKSVDSKTSLFDEKALWEPGYTQVVYLQISNVGSLSLNYKLSVSVENEEDGLRAGMPERGENPTAEIKFYLSEFLKFGAVTDWDGTPYADRAAARAAIGENAGTLKNYSVTGSIKASEKDTDIEYIALVVYMPETVGNEANHLSNIYGAIPYIDLGIMLEAHQMVDENDSFGNDYDKDAFQESNAFADLNENSFTIETSSDFSKFQDLVFNGNTFENKTITLANDIVLSKDNWTPIGNSAKPFMGTFDGNGKTISGLKITQTTADRAGLFGVVEGATIKNVKVEGEISLKGTPADLFNENNDPSDYDIVRGYIGGICGEDKGGSTFDTCTNSVKITIDGLNADAIVGGILGIDNGWGKHGKILNSVNKADITVDNTICDNSYVGGITSISISSSPIIVENCRNEGNVTGGNACDDLYCHS